jgi:hypothetical protein
MLARKVSQKLMIQKISRPLFLVATSLIAGSVLAQDTYSLRRARTADEVLKHQITAEFEMQGQKFSVSLIATDKVVKLTEDGFTYETSQSDMTVTVGGNDVPADPGAKPETVRYLSNGLPVEFESGVSDDNIRINAVVAFVAPDKPVKVGEKWTVNSQFTKPIELVYSGELLAVEKVGDVEAVKVKMEVKDKSAKPGTSSTSTYWLNAKDFSLIKGEGSVTRAPMTGLPDPIDFTFTIEKYADA